MFDVDGTLVDSASDICGAIQTVLEARRHQSPVPLEFLRGYIGRHLIDLFHDLGYAGDDIDALVAEYRQVYPARCHSMTTRYPGVLETLSVLGGRKATATTKGTPTTRVVIEMFGLLPYFDHIQGTDGFPAKPAPDVLFAALKALNAQPEDCLFVGDSPADMESGRAAGVKTCAVRYGYGNIDELARWRPDYWVDDLRELLP